MAASPTAAEVLADAGVRIEFRHVPTYYDPRNQEWQHIAWRVAMIGPHHRWETDYKQGIGHIPKSWGIAVSGRMLRDDEAVREVLKTGRFRGQRLSPPTDIDFLACVLLDALAVDQRFEDWCGDFGYDTDSRKAYATWEACRDVGLELIRLLGRERMEQLRDCEEIRNH